MTIHKAIILQAVDDLRALKHGKKRWGASLKELYEFSHGDYGRLIMGALDGEMVYEKIMKED